MTLTIGCLREELKVKKERGQGGLGRKNYEKIKERKRVAVYKNSLLVGTPVWPCPALGWQSYSSWFFLACVCLGVPVQPDHGLEMVCLWFQQL